MINVIHYTDEPAYRAQYLAMVESLYKHKPSFDHFYADVVAHFDPTNSTALQQQRVSIALEQDDVFIAHVTIICDAREDNATLWFGFFECIESLEIFTQLWQEVCKVCTEWQASVLRGPINGSIWHRYRFISDRCTGTPFFQGELLCQDYYHQFWLPLADKEIQYYSAERTEYTQLIAQTAPAYQQAAEQGFTIERHQSVNADLMQQIFAIARTAFTLSLIHI